MGNAVYINDGNDKALNQISTYFMNHENNKIRTKRITPNFILSFIFQDVIDEKKLIKKIERRLEHEHK